MVRTRADGGVKAVAAKAPRKALVQAASTSSASADSPKAGKYAGGNPVCPRPVPEWQKGIKGFLMKSPKDKENTEPSEKSASAAEGCAPPSPPQPMDCEEGGSSSSAPSKPEKNGLISDDDDD